LDFRFWILDWGGMTSRRLPKGAVNWFRGSALTGSEAMPGNLYLEALPRPENGGRASGSVLPGSSLVTSKRASLGTKEEAEPPDLRSQAKAWEGAIKTFMLNPELVRAAFAKPLSTAFPTQ
jgi:hypothetical protein